jgi:putative membrane protein
MKAHLSFVCALLLVGANAFATDSTSNSTSNNTPNMQESINESTASDQQQAGTMSSGSGTQPGSSDMSGTAGTTTSSGSTTASSSDMKTYQPAMFKREMSFNRLHHLHQSELEMSKMAMDRAESQEVKNYAMQIQRDHEAADKKLQQIAKTQNIELKSFQPATNEVATMDRLRALEGAQFDRAFMDVAQMSHEWDHEALTRLGKEVTDPALKAQINELKPKFNQHLKVARSIKLPRTSTDTSQAG